MYNAAGEVISSTSEKSESVNELLQQLENLFCDPSLPQPDISPVKNYKRDDPAHLLDDLQSLYLSSGQLSPEKAHYSNPLKKSTEQRTLDVEEDELWSASALNKSRQKSKKNKNIQSQVKINTSQSQIKMSSSAAWSTAYDYNQSNDCLNSIPTIGGNAPERSNNKEQGNQGQGFGPPQSMSPNNLDLRKLYFSSPQQAQQQHPQSNYFAGGQRRPGRGGSAPGRGGSAYNRSQYNNGWSNQEPQHQRQYNSYSNHSEPEGKLNPYANEFNPVFNEPAQYNNGPVYNAPNNNHYNNNSYAPPQYHQQHHQPRGQYNKEAREQQPRRNYAVQIEAPEEPTSEIPEGATTVNMPHIYLGKFMMSRGDFETQHGVTITTKSQDGGYLIIIVGEKAAEAGAELEKMWNEEPIRNSDDITEGKVIIKVAPDRWEGVVCFPMEHYAKLLAKRNDVETKHKVRILVKFLPDHSRYRATIRANKKELATEAADDLEALIMAPDPTT